MEILIDSTNPTYTISAQGQANTAASHALAVEAGANKMVRLRKVIILQPGIQTTAGLRNLLLERTTTAGTGNPVVPASHDPVDGAFSGIARAKPTGLGTQGEKILDIPVFVPTALAAFVPMVLDLDKMLGKPVRVPKGITNGIALRDPGAAGGASFAAALVFTEEPE